MDAGFTKKTSRIVKTVLALVLLGASHLCVATPLPEPGLLRVPRIYNALITTDAKLQPSRASPYSVPAVPVIGAPHLSVPHADGDPHSDPHPDHNRDHNTDRHEGGDARKNDNRQPELLDKPADVGNAPANGKNGEKLKPDSKNFPQTFYPQSVGYYPQPYLPYAYPYAPPPFVFGQYRVGAGDVGPMGYYPGIGGSGFGALGPMGYYSGIGGNGFGALGPMGYYSGIGENGFGAAGQPVAGSLGVGGSGSRAASGFGKVIPVPVSTGNQPFDIAVEQSSTMHATFGKRVGEDGAEIGEGDGGQGEEDDQSEEADESSEDVE